jgi:GNAT superfamily N-acetyltransferase
MEPPSDQSDAVPAVPEDPLAGVPELTTYVSTDPDERYAALKLVTDSIAQMRQLANNSFIFNPVHLAVLVAVCAMVIRFMVNRKFEPFIIGTTCTGIGCIALVLARNLTEGYLRAAEEINWDWVGDDADMIVTKFGNEIIGTLIVDWVDGGARQKRKKAWRGEIKAWTVRLKYRGKGVGTALLEEAVKESKKKGAEGIEFSDLHASELWSVLVLEWY